MLISHPHTFTSNARRIHKNLSPNLLFHFNAASESLSLHIRNRLSGIYFRSQDRTMNNELKPRLRSFVLFNFSTDEKLRRHQPRNEKSILFFLVEIIGKFLGRAEKSLKQIA